MEMWPNVSRECNRKMGVIGMMWRWANATMATPGIKFPKMFLLEIGLARADSAPAPLSILSQIRLRLQVHSCWACKGAKKQMWKTSASMSLKKKKKPWSKLTLNVSKLEPRGQINVMWFYPVSELHVEEIIYLASSLKSYSLFLSTPGMAVLNTSD